MADPIITYKRLSSAWTTAKAALDWIIPKVKSTGEIWDANKFVTTDSGEQLSANVGWATSAPPQSTGTGGTGSVSEVARRDHYHPNTCPLPTLPTDIVDKAYVDNNPIACLFSVGIRAMQFGSTATVFDIFTLSTDKVKNGDIAFVDNSYIKILVTGLYKVSLNISSKQFVSSEWTLASISKTTDEAIFTDLSYGKLDGAESSISSTSAYMLANLTANDKICIRGSSATSSNNSISSCSLVVEKV